jgi:hypothetical protein
MRPAVTLQRQRRFRRRPGSAGLQEARPVVMRRCRALKGAPRRRVADNRDRDSGSGPHADCANDYGESKHCRYAESERQPETNPSVNAAEVNGRRERRRRLDAARERAWKKSDHLGLLRPKGPAPGGRRGTFVRSLRASLRRQVRGRQKCTHMRRIVCDADHSSPRPSRGTFRLDGQLAQRGGSRRIMKWRRDPPATADSRTTKTRAL